MRLVIDLLNTVALIIGWMVLAPILLVFACGCGLAVADMFVRKWESAGV